jgi:hypothetical protein
LLQLLLVTNEIWVTRISAWDSGQGTYQMWMMCLCACSKRTDSPRPISRPFPIHADHQCDEWTKILSNKQKMLHVHKPLADTQRSWFLVCSFVCFCACQRRSTKTKVNVWLLIIWRMASSWDVMPCGSCKNRRFGGT